MTCRCQMCGIKNAGKPNRGSYVRAGARCGEGGVNYDSRVKRQGRRKRRRVEKNEWTKEMKDA